MDAVKASGYGQTYSSYASEAIEHVTFYSTTVDYQTYYFAIVCFKNSYFGCREYIYQVSSNTKSRYSIAYLTDAGKAFWKYIEPHSDNLGCSPDLR